MAIPHSTSPISAQALMNFGVTNLIAQTTGMSALSAPVTNSIKETPLTAESFSLAAPKPELASPGWDRIQRAWQKQGEAHLETTPAHLDESQSAAGVFGMAGLAEMWNELGQSLPYVDHNLAMVILFAYTIFRYGSVYFDMNQSHVKQWFDLAFRNQTYGEAVLGHHPRSFRILKTESRFLHLITGAAWLMPFSGVSHPLPWNLLLGASVIGVSTYFKTLQTFKNDFYALQSAKHELDAFINDWQDGQTHLVMQQIARDPKTLGKFVRHIDWNMAIEKSSDSTPSLWETQLEDNDWIFDKPEFAELPPETRMAAATAFFEALLPESRIDKATKNQFGNTAKSQWLRITSLATQSWLCHIWLHPELHDSLPDFAQTMVQMAQNLRAKDLLNSNNVWPFLNFLYATNLGGARQIIAHAFPEAAQWFSQDQSIDVRAYAEKIIGTRLNELSLSNNKKVVQNLGTGILEKGKLENFDFGDSTSLNPEASSNAPLLISAETGEVRVANTFAPQAEEVQPDPFWDVSAEELGGSEVEEIVAVLTGVRTPIRFMTVRQVWQKLQDASKGLQHEDPFEVMSYLQKFSALSRVLVNYFANRALIHPDLMQQYTLRDLPNDRKRKVIVAAVKLFTMAEGDEIFAKAANLETNLIGLGTLFWNDEGELVMTELKRAMKHSDPVVAEQARALANALLNIQFASARLPSSLKEILRASLKTANVSPAQESQEESDVDRAQRAARATLERQAR